MSHKYDLLVCTGIYPPDIGGPATYSKTLFEELPKRGFSVKILSFGEVRSLPKIIRHFAYAWKVLRLASSCRVVYVQDPVSVGLPVMLACGLLGKKYVLKIVGDYAWEQGSQRFGVTDLLDEFSVKKIGYAWPVRLLKKIETKVAKRAETIVVPSNYLKKIVSNWGIDPNKIKVIYNAFDEPENLLSKDDLRRELNLTDHVVTSVGRLVPWKGFDLLIEIMSELIPEFPDLKLYIIGDGPEKDNLSKLILERKLQEKVFLVGRLKRLEVLKFLKASDLFILNTSYEGFSHQLLEVAWCEAPMITTAVGGNIELIKDGENGLLTSYNDKEALKSAWRFMLLDQDRARTLATSAKQTVLSFNKEKMLSGLIEVLF